MPKSSHIQIGPRDTEILLALDRCPLTSGQILKVSQTFPSPFSDGNNLRRRLRSLTEAGFIQNWPYAVASDGRSPRYFKLTRDGYVTLYGPSAAPPNRRYFEEIRPGHHHHTRSLADFLVHTLTCGHKHGMRIRQFARENSFSLTTGSFTLYPDAAFQMLTPDGRDYNFVVELDNGTERVRSKQDVESIERKLRGYDAHQSRYGVHDRGRYLVLFVTTRTQERVDHILNTARAVMSNAQRTVFLATDLTTFLQCDPIVTPVLADNRGDFRTLVRATSIDLTKPTISVTAAAAA